MTSTCTRCGKEVRPGAKFCGSCGAPQEDIQAAGPPQGEQIACPHCGKPVRKDAKYCASCGQSIPTAAVPAAAVAAPSPISPEPPADAQTPAPTPTGDTYPSAPPPQKSFFSKYWWIFLIIIAVCLASVFALSILSKNGTITFPGITPATETATPTQTSPGVIEPTFTQTIQRTKTATTTATNTLTHTPEPVPTEEIPTESSPTEETSTEEPTETLEPLPTPSPVVVFEEKFEEPLEVNWDIWGDPPLPTIVGVGRNSALKLDSEIRASGVTGKEFINVGAEFEITFDAALQNLSPDDILAFDWHQENNGSQPGEPGMVQIVISDGTAEMIITRPDDNCRKRITDTDLHNYIIRFDDQSNATFLINNEIVCTLSNQGVSIGNGKLNFQRKRLD